MRQRVVALTGVSGVGKTTLVTVLAGLIPIEHLRAGVLIEEGRSALGLNSLAYDELRLGDLDENQQLFVRGFKSRINPTDRIVIVDSHTVIEQDNALIRIAPSVFAAIGIDGMIFLQDDPLAITKRRRDDRTRKRPAISAEYLKTIQEEARAHAGVICRELRVPLNVFHPEQRAEILSALPSGQEKPA